MQIAIHAGWKECNDRNPDKNLEATGWFVFPLEEVTPGQLANAERSVHHALTKKHREDNEQYDKNGLPMWFATDVKVISFSIVQ